MSDLAEHNASESKLRYIMLELAHHLPFSIFGVAAGMLLMGILTFLSILIGAEQNLSHASGELFHLFHPSHVLFSAVATTAMFWKHDNHNWIKASLVGFFGSVTICGISDIFLPFFGGLFLGADMHLHICILEEPGLVFPFAVVGVCSGLFVSKTFENSTQYSHTTHVLISAMASILYLLGYGLHEWMHTAGGVLLVTIFAVMIPCCLSDIVFPLTCTHKYCKHK